MTNTILRESKVRKGRHIITVLAFESGEVLMYVDDIRSGISEEIVLREYIDAYEVYYDFNEGWMADGHEIPYLDSF